MKKSVATNVAILECVKRRFSHSTDLELAGFLGVSKDTISGIRNNRTVVGEALRFTIMDKMIDLEKFDNQVRSKSMFKDGGVPLTEKNNFQNGSLMLACSPKMLLIRLRELQGEQCKGQRAKCTLAKIDEEPVVGEDADLLDLYKSFKQFVIDADVSKTLGIKRNSVSMVRHGGSRLGPLPRLRIYRDVYGRDTENLEAALESNDALLTLITDRSR